MILIAMHDDEGRYQGNEDGGKARSMSMRAGAQFVANSVMLPGMHVNHSLHAWCIGLLLVGACTPTPSTSDAGSRPDLDGSILDAGAGDASTTRLDASVRDAGDSGPAIVDSGSLDAATATDASDASATFDAAMPDSGAVTDAAIADAAAPDGCAHAATRDSDLWVWGTDEVTNIAARDALLSFAEDRGLRTIYVDSQALLSSAPSSLATFIAEADGRCISVELLFGRAAWTLSANHEEALSIARAAVTFANGLAIPPTALHFDVEPHGLAEWDSDRQSTANQYLDLLEALKLVAGTTLRLNVDIPFWLDVHDITRNGVTRKLHLWTLDIVDGATMMDYRDHAAAPDGIIDNAANELTYAATIGKQVVLGVETQCNLEPEVVTFCEEGAAWMTQELAAVRVAYAGDTAFGGFDIHYYDSYLALAP